MPTYLLHGFRWPRDSIRIHFIVHHLEHHHSPTWIMAPAATDALRRNLNHLYPASMASLPDLSFVEQHNPTSSSAALPSQPFAYVADVVQEIKLGLAVDEVTTKGIDNDQWSAIMDLRDQLAPTEKVAWFVVVCADDQPLTESERPRLISRDGWNREPKEQSTWDFAGVSVRQPRMLRRLFSHSTLNKKKAPKSSPDARPSSSHTVARAAPVRSSQAQPSVSLDPRLPAIARNRLPVRPRTSESSFVPGRRADLVPAVPFLPSQERPTTAKRHSLATRWNPDGFEPAFEQKVLLTNDGTVQDVTKSPTPPLEDDDSSMDESTSARDTDRSLSPVRDISASVSVYRPGNAFTQHDFMKKQHMEALDALTGKSPPLAHATSPIVPRDKAAKRHTLPATLDSDTDESDFSDVPKSVRDLRKKRREKRFSAISSVSAFSHISEEEVTQEKETNDGSYFGQKVDERDLIATGLEDCFDRF